MTKNKQFRFLVTVPRGEEDRFKMWARVLKTFNKSANARTWSLISEDIDRLIDVIKILEEGEKHNEST
jgi:hypothetical protein